MGGGNMKFRTTSICTFGLFVLALTALVVYRVTSAGSAYAAFSGSNGRITFARFNPAIGDFQIFAANPDGSHETQLTTLPSAISDWSPDGSKIAFDFASDATSANIATINPDGSGFVQLTHEQNDVTVEPAWSPDGTRMAVARPIGDHPHGIFIIDAATGAILSQVTANPYGWFDGEPRWSPDGQWIAFDRVKKAVRGTDMVAAFVVRSDGTDLRQLTSWGRQGQYPDWSPDGSKIAITSRSEPFAPASIFTINPDGSDMELVIKNTGIAGFEHPPGFSSASTVRWSPDGTKLIFQGSPDFRHIRAGLWTVDADGSNLTEIISGPPNPSFPAWGTHPQQ
jgi:Tol biopolymer transport system component